MLNLKLNVNENVPVLFLKDSKITLDQFRAFGFTGAVELGNMFDRYKRGKPDRNIELTKKLNPDLHGFDAWVKANKEMIENNINSLNIQS